VPVTPFGVFRGREEIQGFQAGLIANNPGLACHDVSGGGGSRGGGSGGGLACLNTPSINICRGGGRP
jgi:hypothetical protein